MGVYGKITILVSIKGVNMLSQDRSITPTCHHRFLSIEYVDVYYRKEQTSIILLLNSDRLLID